jgi:kynureninase
VPRPGAAGYQLSNPSALDLSAVVASLEIFSETSMTDLRRKSISLTRYLEKLLLQSHASKCDRPFTIITSNNVNERGAQLSLQLQPGLLEGILHSLEESGAVVDERKPDVIRVSPAPLYNSYLDVWNFVQVFFEACQKAIERKTLNTNGVGSNSGGGSPAHIAAELVQAENQARGAKAYAPNAK